MVKGLVLKNVGSAVVAGVEVENCAVGVDISSVGHLKIDHANLRNNTDGMIIDSVSSVVLGEIKIRGRLDHDLVREVRQTVVDEPEVGAVQLADRFGERFRPYGIDLWDIAEKGVTAGTIAQWLLQAAGLGG